MELCVLLAWVKGKEEGYGEREVRHGAKDIRHINVAGLIKGVV